MLIEIDDAKKWWKKKWMMFEALKKMTERNYMFENGHEFIKTQKCIALQKGILCEGSTFADFSI